MGDERVKLDALDDHSDNIAAQRHSPPDATCLTGETAPSAILSANQSAQSADSSANVCENASNIPSAAATTGSGESTPAAPRLSYEALEQHCRNVEDELQTLRDTELRLKQHNTDSLRRERILIRRLALKEQEIQDYSNQIAEYKSAQVPGPVSLRSSLLDPAVNILVQKLKAELQATRARLEDTQNELSAWKFTPDSNTGKRLMAKCRLLYQENEELGKMTSNGRLAKLEGDLALQKSFSEEVKKSQSELDDFLQELDEDVEGMQSTILFLQQELKTSKETIGHLESELAVFKHVADPDPESEPSLANNSDQTFVTTNGDRIHHNITEKSPNGQPTNTDQPSETNLTDDDLAKTTACERILRKDRAGSTTNINVSVASGKSLLQAPRTLRSSSRHISTEDLRVGKVNVRNVQNGNNEVYDEVLDEEIAEGEEVDDEACNSYAASGELVSTQVNNGSANRKRSYEGEESDTSEQGVVPDTESSAPAIDVDVASNSLVVNHKKFTKRVRRSSVLSMDLNEEDSRIEFDTERTLRETANGNGGIAEA